MEAVLAVHAGAAVGRLDQLGTDQLVEQVLGVGERLVQQRGAQPAGEGRHVQQRQPPEQPLGLLAGAVVGEREARADVHVAVAELVQAACLVREALGQLLDAPVRPGGQPRAGDAQRQREVTAVPGDGRRLRPRLDAGRRDAGQQVGGGAGVEDGRLDVLAAGQPGEPSSAGDDDPGRRAAGQQRRYLVLARRVVEHDQDLAAREQVAVHLRALVQAVRYLRSRHPERTQEPVEHLRGPDRIGGPRVQVGEQLPVREMPRQAVRCVDGEAGLAYPALARDYHDGHRQPGLAPCGAGQAPADLPDLLRPVGEVRDVGRQQARNLLPADLDRDGRGRQVKGRVAGQDGSFDLPQPLTGLDAQLIDHGPSGLPIHRQRLGRTPAAVQGEHQQAAQLFSQGILTGELDELAGQLMVPAQVEFEGEPVLVDGDPLLVQPAGRRPQQLAVQAGQRGPAPEPERVAVVRDRLRAVRGIAGRGHQFLEPQRVEPPLADLDGVAVGLRGDDRGVSVRGKQPPERGNADLRLRPRGRREVFAVDRLQQPVHADHVVRVQQQRGQHDLLADTGQLEPLRAHRHLERSEDPELHQITAPVTSQSTRIACETLRRPPPAEMTA